MEIILKIQEADLLLRREEMSARDRYTDYFQEKQIVIDHEQVGTITNNQITTGNFFIDHYQFQPNQTIRLVREIEEDAVQMDFILQGDNQMLSIENTSRQQFSTGQHNICNVPKSKSRYDYFVSAQPLDYTVIVIPKEVYFRLMPPDSDLHQLFVSQISQGRAAFMASQNPPITPAMDWLIRDMRASQRTGSLKRLLIEARVTELLMLQLEQLHGAPSVELPTQTADVRKLNEARELLDASYANPPTIIELAKLVGLNEFSLKRGFKAKFRTTILGYITQRRMEEARRFLLEGEKSISEISYWVGYKNPAHFTVAFKHFFGVLPSTIRTQSDQ